jgi:hypothetical protein
MLNDTYRIGMIPWVRDRLVTKVSTWLQISLTTEKIRTPEGIRPRSEKLQTHTLDRVATTICFIFPTRICMLILLIKE